MIEEEFVRFTESIIRSNIREDLFWIKKNLKKQQGKIDFSGRIDMHSESETGYLHY